jgi:hypothetical protein
MEVRVLVTGSRDWPYPEVVEMELDRLLTSPLIVVHGACPRGADLHADRWACEQERLGVYQVRPEAHPAKWNSYGKTAGPIRNQEMVNLGADLCLAFRYMGSKGTQDCVNRAHLAGIPVRMLELDLIELKGCK